MSSKSNLETLKDHLDLSFEYEPYTVPNTNVVAANYDGKNYIRVGGGGGGTSISDQSGTCLPLGSPFTAKNPEQGLKFR